MPGQLGVGVRVFVGYVPPSKCGDDVRGRQCATGTITEGPYPAGSCLPKCWTVTLNNGSVVVGPRNDCGYTWWLVDYDNGDGLYAVAEPFLFPIDDGDPHAEPREQDLEVEA